MCVVFLDFVHAGVRRHVQLSVQRVAMLWKYCQKNIFSYLDNVTVTVVLKSGIVNIMDKDERYKFIVVSQNKGWLR